MQRKTKIGAGQFFTMMFVSQSVVTMALSAGYTGGENPLDSIPAVLLSAAAGFVIALPLWALASRYPYLNPGDAARFSLGKAGKLVSLCYVLYFILVSGSTLGLFEICLLDTADPELSTPLVLAAMTCAALYGALRGTETVARSAFCVFILLLLGAGTVFVIVSSRFRRDNLEPLFFHGTRQFAVSAALFLSRTSVFADMAVLLPLVKGRRLLGFSLWSAGTAGFLSLVLLLLAGCLGRYYGTRDFPVHALASITEVRSLQRLDAVFTGVWLMGTVVRLSSALLACRVCLAPLVPGRAVGWWTAGTAAAILTAALAMARIPSFAALLGDRRSMGAATAFVCLGLPLLVLGADRTKNGKQGGKTHEAF